MDPVSVCATISGLAVTIEQIVAAIYRYGKGVNDSRKEMNQLCSELFALKGALEHVRMNLQDAEASSTSAAGSLSAPIIGTKEFINMLDTTESALADLLKRLEKPHGRVTTALNRLTWPLKKDDIRNETQRLDRLKLYFILATTTDNLETSKQMYLEIRSLAQKLDDQQQQHDTAAQADFRKSVIRWLAPFDPSQLYRTSLASEQVGTGKWFLDGPFQDWVSGLSPPILWLRGKPGIGKTTLVSAAINKTELQSDEGANVVTYFFCSFTNAASQDSVNLIGSLLIQLCSIDATLWTGVDARYSKESTKSNSSSEPLSLGEVTSMLGDALRKFPKVHIIVDALNESKQSALMFSTLWDLRQGHEGLRILFSSTEELLVPAVQRDSRLLNTVYMTSALVNDDIRLYVESCLACNDRLRRLPIPLKDDIRSKLFSRADGMFRWVQCQIDGLVVQRTPLAIKAALEAVPPTLEQTYCNILLRIPSEDRALAKKAFLWMAFSIQALDFEELCEAVILDEESGTVDEDARLLQPEDLLQVCSSLVSFDTKENTVVLAHSSVLEYLTSEQIKESKAREFYLDPASADTRLARQCVSYLCSPKLQSGYCIRETDLDDRYQDMPLLGYAADSWPVYAQRIEKRDIDEVTRHLLLRFCETSKLPRCGNFGAWVQAYHHSAKFEIETSTPLYYAAKFGINSMVKMILAVEGTRNLEERGGNFGSTPLHVASYSGHFEVVQTLLAAGANAKETNTIGECGLAWAAFEGRLNITKALLDAGANPNFRDSYGCTPLYHAFTRGSIGCSMALLGAGADTINIDGDGLDVTALAEKLKESILLTRGMSSRGLEELRLVLKETVRRIPFPSTNLRIKS